MNDPTITVYVGSEAREVPHDSTLAELVAALGHSATAVATALNGEFVPRDARARQRLADGDRVHCFKPITGG